MSDHEHRWFDDLRQMEMCTCGKTRIVGTRDDPIALMAKAWDEGFKQGGPMHDVHLDDPDAHTRNPYREGENDAQA